MENKLQAAIGLILKPLSKLLMRSEISHASASEMLKTALVEVATEKLIELNESVTDTRIHLMTGVHRKDVKRIREFDGSNEAKQTNMPLTSQVLSKWIGDTNFLDTQGMPRPLEKKSNTDGNGFDDLIYSLSKDVRPKSVLDEMLSRKMVAINDAGMVELKLENIIANQPPEEKAYFLGINIHDHLDVATDNLSNPNNPQLERSAHYFGLSESAALELEQYSRDLGVKALIAINEKAQELIKNSNNHGSWDTNFGVYSRIKEQAIKKEIK